MVKNFILFLIRFYQRILSPDQGILSVFFRTKTCRFYPSCSEYVCLSVKKYGVFGGLLRGWKRLTRCHPWGGCGVDMP